MAEIKLENNEDAKAEKKIVIRNLNLRIAPNLESEIIRVMQKGEEVEVIDYEDDWARLKDGFCMKQYLN